MKRHILMIFILSLLLSASFQGTRGLFESTEGRYSECALEMVDSNNYLDPTLNFKPHWTKPPFTYWAIALGIKIFGKNEWGVRFYLIVVYIITSFAIYFLGIYLWNEKNIALLCSLIYITMVGPLGAINTVNTDSLLTMWIALVYLFYWKAIKENNNIWIIFMWIALGFGFLTKATPIIIPFFITLIIYHYLLLLKNENFLKIKDKNNYKIKFFNIIGIILFFIIGGTWFIYEIYTHKNLLKYWIQDEIIKRAFSNKFKRNPEWYKGFEIYIPFLIGGSLPWILFILYFYYKNIYNFFKSILKNIRNFFKNYKKISYEILFLIITILLPFIVFCISKSKLPLYVLSLFIPLALLYGKYLFHKIEENKIKIKKIYIFIIILVIFEITVKGLISYYLVSRKDMKRFSKLVLSQINKINIPLDELKYTNFYLITKRDYYGLVFYLRRYFNKLEKISLKDSKKIDRLIKNFPKLLKNTKNILILIKYESIFNNIKNKIYKNLNTIDKILIKIKKFKFKKDWFLIKVTTTLKNK